MRKAFSYARFSTAAQADGHSLSRQLDAAKAYCARNGLILDERSFCDLGMSGFHGANATAGDLGAFIELVKDGRIPKGSVLIVENTDRLSRLPPDEANRIITGIVKAGIDVVTTMPEQVYTAANIGKLATWLPLQVSQCLAREESEKKADRLRDAWQRKRGKLADEQAGERKFMSKKGPAWLKLSADRRQWIVLEDKAAIVRVIFQWSVDGMGVGKICERLHREYPGGLTGKEWQPAQVATLLRNRAVLGEFQPHVGTCAKKGGVKSTRKPVGEPIKDYFPWIVSEAVFYQVQRGLDARRHGGGRVTGVPNLFNGCVWDARDQRRMVIGGSHGRRVLVSSGAIRRVKGSAFRTVRYEVFERAVLSLLRELKPQDVLGRAGPGEDAVEMLSGKLAAVNHNITRTQQRAAQADDPSVFLDLLDDYGRQRKKIIRQLEEAKATAASQTSDNLGECVSLIGLLAEADERERDGLRRRVKAAIRRLVESVWVLIIPRGHERLVAVQVWFAASQRRRDYLVYYRPPHKDFGGRAEEHLRACSLADLPAPGDLDLRKPAHARRLEKALAALDVAELAEHMPRLDLD